MRRALGISMWVPRDAARDHLRMLRSAPNYLSYEIISEVSGLSYGLVAEIGRGSRDRRGRPEPVKPPTIHRDTEASILGVPNRRPEGALSGSRMRPHGVVRRIQAMYRMGYSARVLAEECGLSDAKSVRRILSGHAEYAFFATHAAVCEAYDRLSGLDPMEYGLAQQAVRHTQTMAARHNYPGPGCWDVDTIDDPDAHPEWTGACGTERGYQIHYREKIPYCPPCSRAHHEYKLEHPGKSPLKEQRWAEVRRLSEQRGMTVEQIAQELDISERTVTRALKEEEA